MIYCVEDDEGIRNMVVYTLTASNFSAKGIENGEKFWAACNMEKPELVLLDIMLPGEDGLSILKKMRENTLLSKIPVIMTTAKGTEFDKVRGLDLGADDYLAKPFGMMEMVSRVRAVLRRSEGVAINNLLEFYEIKMDLHKRAVYVNDESVHLTLKEFEILKLMLENPGQVFTRELLINSVWDMEFMGESRTVDVHIGTLRTKLGKAGEYIRTVHSIGYKLEK